MTTTVLSPWSSSKPFKTKPRTFQGVEEAMLLPSLNSPEGEFGSSVAINDKGDVCVIGSPGRPWTGYTNSAYIYEFENSSWILKAKFTGSDVGHYGRSVDISGDGKICIVSEAKTYVNGGSSDPATVYIFQRTDQGWELLQSITLPQYAGAGKTHGAVIRMSSDASVLAITMGNDSPTYGKGPGSLLIYRRSNGLWSKETEILNPYDRDVVYCTDLGVSGDGTTICIKSSPRSDAVEGYVDDKNLGLEIFRFQSGTWVKKAFFYDFNPVSTQTSRMPVLDIDYLGETVVLIGGQGTVRVFDRFGESWSNTGTIQHWGLSVSLTADGDKLAVGIARYYNGYSDRLVLTYIRDNFNWTVDKTIVKPGYSGVEDFGESVAFNKSGNVLLVGTPGADVNGQDSGCVLVFK